MLCKVECNDQEIDLIKTAIKRQEVCVLLKDDGTKVYLGVDSQGQPLFHTQLRDKFSLEKGDVLEAWFDLRNNRLTIISANPPKTGPIKDAIRAKFDFK